MIAIIKEPFLFNCYKHHLGFIGQRICKVKNADDLATFVRELILTGSSVMDIYTGMLAPAEITACIEQFLIKEMYLSYGNYTEWINDSNHYRLIRISDNSSWILRKGASSSRYVHFHPARNSLHSIRANSTTLKTAAAAVAYSNIYNCKAVDISIINKVRKEFLDLSQLKTLTGKSPIMRLINMLTD